ncbi:hypothetical protein GCM10009716_03870 [Streptomyces sodiiphilus]|uniref:DUF2771 domain-containing protein n=1 Tax=Streptomyces sodiiphilus TaxID=226217 RepID=A0ABP5A0T8_9ACTN
MTAISSGGRRAVRTTLAAGAVSLGLVTLSACEKPTSYAHFTLGSDTSSVETPSGCYGHGEPLSEKRVESCLEKREGAPEFAALEGDMFRIGVDPSIAETGWVLYINGTQVTEPMTSTYRSFPADQILTVGRQQAPADDPEAEAPADALVSIVQVDEDYDPEAQDEEGMRVPPEILGVWHALLTPDE